MDFNKFIEKYFDPNDDTGFNEIIFEREARHKAIKERLKKYYLSEKEINSAFEIIINAEIEIEKEKRKFNKKNYNQQDLFKLQKKLFEIQVKMKKDFDEKVNSLLKKKYEQAKKIKEELDKKNPYK